MKKKSVWFLFFGIFIIFLGFGGFLFFMIWMQFDDLQWSIADLQKNNIELQSTTEQISQNNIELKTALVVENVKSSIAVVSAYKTTDYIVEDLSSLGDGFYKKYRVDLVWWTAFVVHPQWYLLTSKHVVDDKTADYEILLNWKKYFLDKRWFFDDLDLALIRVKDSEGNVPLDFIPLSLDDQEKNIIIGQSVVSLGKLTAQNNIAMISSMISAISEDFVDNNKLKHYGSYVVWTSFPSGFSGWPLLDLDWQVIAVNTAVSNEWFSYALPVDQQLLQKFFDELVESKIE